MIRALVKMALYGLVGYAAYEFFRGMSTAQQQLADGGSGDSRSGGGRRMPQGASRSRSGAALTGNAGDGERIQTAETDGGSVPHQVGRGVIHR